MQVAGFNKDEIGAAVFKEQNAMRVAGFSDSEIDKVTGSDNDTWMQKVQKPATESEQITPALENGFSPTLEVGGRKGRFNFDIDSILDKKTPGRQYQFEAEDGNNFWFQLENNYQGGRWDAADHAETNYNEYKTWGAETRKELLNQMWAGSPKIAEFIDNAVKDDMPWAEVQEGLKEFNTYRQISNTETSVEDPVDEDLMALILNPKYMDAIEKRGIANMVVPDFESAIEILNKENATPEQLEEFIKMQALFEGTNNDENNLSQEEWTKIDTVLNGLKTGTIGTLTQIIRHESGRPIKESLEDKLRVAAYSNQPQGKQVGFRISNILSELLIMIPAGVAASTVCGPTHPYIKAGCFVAGALGVPAYFRKFLTDVYDEELGIVDYKSLMVKLVRAKKEGSLEAMVGFLVGLSSHGSKVAMTNMGVPKLLVPVLQVPIEAGVYVSASSAFHGTYPTLENFRDAVIDFSILKAGGAGFKTTSNFVRRNLKSREENLERNLKKMYAESGIDPRTVRADIKENPELAKQLWRTLSKREYVLPEYYYKQVTEVMTRLEQVSRSDIKVGEKEYTVSRYHNVKKGEIEVMAQTSGKGKKPEPDMITFKLTKDGNWTIKKVEGNFDINGIKAIADFTRTTGRDIVNEGGFEKVYEVINKSSEAPKTLDPRDEIVADIMSDVRITEAELRQSGGHKAADEIVREGEKLMRSAVGDKFYEQSVKNVKDFQEAETNKVKRDSSNAEWRETGFHTAETILKNPLGKIDKLDIKEHDIQTEMIVSHATETHNIAAIKKTGMDVAFGKGFLHFGTDAQAEYRAKGLTNPAFMRVQVKYNKPLDLRKMEGADERTNGLVVPIQFATFLHQMKDDLASHPAKLTDLEFEEIRKAQGIDMQSLKLAEILQGRGRGYDAIIYKNQIEGAEGYSVAIMDNANIKVLGYDTYATKAESKKDSNPLNFTETPEAKVTPKGYATDGGYNLNLIEGSTQANKIMNMPALIELVNLLMDGKLPGIYKNLGEGTQGLFQHTPGKGKDSGKLKLRADIFKDPKMAAKTVAHEIGHMVDWLEGAENYTMSRGNILGRLAGLKKYLNTYMEGRPGGKKPLTQKEKNKLRYEAEKFIKNEVQSISNIKEIKELGITPQQIKDIFTGVMKRAEVDPQLYLFIQKAGRKLKKDITKAAMRGKIHPEILKVITSGKEKGTPTEDIRKRVLEKYHEMFQKEVTERELLSRDIVMEELKKVTQAWRPFDETADPKYTKYRHNTKELYADFFSALMTNPQFAKITAPTAYEGFFNFINSKPTFKKAYDKVQTELSAGKTLDIAEERVREGFRKGEAMFFERIEKDDYLIKGNKRNLGVDWIDQYWHIIQDVRNYKGAISIDRNPVNMIDRMRYQASASEAYMGDMSYMLADRMIENNISAEDFGMYLFYRRIATEKGGTERGDIANPMGHDKESASIKLAEFEARSNVYFQLANDLWKIRKEFVIDELEKTKMYPKALMDKLKKNDAYAKYDVLEYFDQHFGEGSSGRIFGQTGTLKEIANPFTRTIASDVMLMKAARKNIALTSTLDFYREASIENPDTFTFLPAKKVFKGDYMDFLESSDPKLKLITVMQNGKMEGYYLNSYVAEAFIANPLDANKTINIMRAANNAIRMVLTDINPGFWMTNAKRDYDRTFVNLPGMKKNVPIFQTTEYFKYWKRGFKPAYESLFGIPGPVVREMLKGNMLISVQERANDYKLDTEFERLLVHFSKKPRRWEKGVTNPLKWLYEHFSFMNQVLERQNKVAAYLYLTEKYPDMPKEVLGNIIRVQAGSPAFLRKGRLNPVVNNLAMFSNAMKEGWRGDIEVIKDRPGEYVYKRVQRTLIPKMLMYAIATGLLGDEMSDLMNDISEYDKANYTIIPLGRDKEGKPVYLRIPQDEMGRLIGGVWWKAQNLNKTKDVNDLISYTGGQVPSLSPTWTALSDVWDYVMDDENPYDGFRQRSVLDQNTFEAGGSDANIAMVKHISNTLGGSIVWRFNTTGLPEIKSEIEELLDFPIANNTLGRFVKVGNQGLRERINNPVDVIQESAQHSINANRAINKIVMGLQKEITDEEWDSLYQKRDGLNKRAKRIFSEQHGNIFVNELLKARSSLHREQIWRNIRKMSEEGHQAAKEFLGITDE